MSRWATFGAGIAVGLVASLALARSAEIPLKGSLVIRGATIVDPPPEEPGNTHAEFIIDGPAAQALFEAIKAPAREDECLGDGSISKRAGNVACIRRADSKAYECDFSLDLVKQRIDIGRAC